MPIRLGSNKIGKIYYGKNKIGKIYKGSQLVYSADPYTPNQVLLNVNTGGSGTVNFYKGKYHIYAQGAGGGGGNNNFWYNGGGGGSGAGFNGYVVFNEDVLNVKCTTGTGAKNVNGGATVITGIFNLGGGEAGNSNYQGVGGTYSFTSSTKWYIQSSTVAKNGNPAFAASPGVGYGQGGNSVLTNSGSNPTVNQPPTALGAGGNGDQAGKGAQPGAGGECKITYIGQV